MKGERLGEFEELVLLVAAVLNADASAVAIQRGLRERARRPASLGAIYAALDRLERKGFLTSEVRDARAAAERRKRFFDLTSRGHEALAESRQVREALYRQVQALGEPGGRP